MLNWANNERRFLAAFRRRDGTPAFLYFNSERYLQKWRQLYVARSEIYRTRFGGGGWRATEAEATRRAERGCCENGRSAIISIETQGKRFWKLLESSSYHLKFLFRMGILNSKASQSTTSLISKAISSTWNRMMKNWNAIFYALSEFGVTKVCDKNSFLVIGFIDHTKRIIWQQGKALKVFACTCIDSLIFHFRKFLEKVSRFLTEFITGWWKFLGLGSFSDGILR